MQEQDITYFGYGSLVNRATRPSAERAQPARLHGWRRVWGHRVIGSADARTGAKQSCCSLSVEPISEADSSQFIDGVLVTIPLSELPVLDERENGYERVMLPASDFTLPQACDAKNVHVYVSDDQHAGRSNKDYPILQSYVDCVLAGYCAVFDQAGMQHFVDTTVGWEGTIENERTTPKYPRAVTLSKQQLDTIDALVSERRLRVDDSA